MSEQPVGVNHPAGACFLTAVDRAVYRSRTSALLRARAADFNGEGAHH